MQEQYQFKVGDKVKYKEDQGRNACHNGHSPTKVYTIKRINTKTENVSFDDEHGGWCWVERLELVSNRHKHADLMIAYANDTSLKFQCRTSERDMWMDVESAEPYWNPKLQYRIKPKTITKYQVLYLMTKYNMANVTADYYTDEQDFLIDNSHGSKFIQLVKETAREFEVQ